MNRLVVCADDAGLARSTDEAILRCARQGVVCVASVVAGGPTAEAFLGDATGIEIGLHLNLTEGRALAGPAATLTDGAGCFVTPKREVWRRAIAGELDAGEVRREVEAQWNWLRDRGVEPSHINGHNHVHVFEPVRAALPECAWVRVPRDPCLPIELEDAFADMSGRGSFCGHAFAHEPTIDVFLRCLEAADDVCEFMVHPGSRPGTEFTAAPERNREIDVLCSSELAAELRRLGLRLVSFGELACA